MREITQASTFVCHKTTGEEKMRLQCAGHMILMKNDNEFVRMAHIFKQDLKLSGETLIFDTPEECVEHHKN